MHGVGSDIDLNWDKVGPLQSLEQLQSPGLPQIINFLLRLKKILSTFYTTCK